MTTDLPSHAVACALELVGAVRDRDPAQVAHVLRNAASQDGLEALCVSLAAMVDDENTLDDMLAWTGAATHDDDLAAWREQLTDHECRNYRNAYLSGSREPEVVDGWRECEKRNSRRTRMRRARQLRAAS